MAAVVYRSKVDAWLVILLLFVWAVSSLPFVVTDSTSASSWVISVIVTLLFVVIFYMLFSIRYIIDGNTLTVKDGFLSKDDYDIRQIKSIKPTGNALASPAASLDRLEIRFTNNREALLISPKDKQGFITHICQINTNVVC